MQAPVPQLVAQVPQCAALLLRSTSQPLLATPSQSAKPLLQVNPQVPLPQVAVALARAGHALPQAPQFVSDVVTFTSQPLADARSQSAKPAEHT